jgi:hypothetical protein
LQQHFSDEGRKYSRSVLYENLDFMVPLYVGRPKAKQIGDRFVKAYPLTDIGYAWSVWLSLPDDVKTKCVTTLLRTQARGDTPIPKEIVRSLIVALVNGAGSAVYIKDIAKETGYAEKVLLEALILLKKRDPFFRKHLEYDLSTEVAKLPDRPLIRALNTDLVLDTLHPFLERRGGRNV